MIIKEIPHKSAKARAKAENKQQARAISNIVKSVGNSVVKALSKSAKGSKGTKAKAPRPRSVKATIDYVIKGDNDTRGELIYSQHLYMLEPEMISIAMETTAEMNQAVENPCKHFVISWPEDEKPTRQQMTRSIVTFLKFAGYEEHQAVAYLHQDTEKTHIHIVANHVHPETFKAVHRNFLKGKENYKIRERVARQLEIANGWKQVEGKLHKLDADGKLVERTYEEKILFSQTHKDRISDKSQRQESHSGKPSFERWCKESREAEHLKKDIKKIVSGKNIDWNDIHKTLEKYNVAIRPDKYGKGLVVYDKHDPEARCTAASGLSRDLTAGNLGKLISTPFVPPVQSGVTPLTQTKIKPPIQQPVVDLITKTKAVEFKTKSIESPAPLVLTARPDVMARHYGEYASKVAAADPNRAAILRVAAAKLKKLPNGREITLPHPSAPVAEITAAMKGIGGRGR